MADVDPGESALAGIESTIMALGGEALGSSSGVSTERGRERYERRGLLGEGGMGRVERVWDSDLMREVAVKEIRAELGTDARLLEQFLWEARVAAYLDHPNIVPVHDLGVSRHGRLYFTMKCVHGRSLEDALAGLGGQPEAEREFSLGRRLRAFLQLCNAIGSAHARGVLHRDLKPANVMLGAHGEVLVTDWGLAITLPGRAGDELLAQMPEVVKKSGSGTPAYMSPEQAKQEELDERSDVYALGTILYELVELERAIRAPTLPAILLKVVGGEVRPMTRASPSLGAVIRRAMAVDRDARYPNVEALAKEVEVVLDGRTPEAESANVVTRAARYYMGRDPSLAKLQTWELDLWMLAAFCAGAALALRFGVTHAGGWWIAALLALCLAIPPTVGWHRLRVGSRS